MITLQQRGIQKIPLDLLGQKAAYPDIIDDDFWAVVPVVYDYTELPIEVLFNLYSAVKYVCENRVVGDLVECGVHLGGSVMTMQATLKKFEPNSYRRVFALDTFFGFVSRNEELDIDIQSGLPACIPQEHADDFSVDAIDNMKSIGFERLNVVKGDVMETIPTLKMQQIAILRLDTDTYETTKFELEQLYGRVSPGGVVIVDDYGYTIGCKKAVDDFILQKKVLLQRINLNCRAWIKANF